MQREFSRTAGLVCLYHLPVGPKMVDSQSLHCHGVMVSYSISHSVNIKLQHITRNTNTTTGSGCCRVPTLLFSYAGAWPSMMTSCAGALFFFGQKQA